MTQIDVFFMEHLHQPITTLTRLWLITRTDGVRLGFTDHSRDITIDQYDPIIYRAEAGFTASAIATDNSASAADTEVESYISSDSITSDDIRAGRYYDARIDIMIINYKDPPTYLPFGGTPSTKVIVYQSGMVGEITASGEDSFRFEVRGLSSLLSQKVGLTTQTLCATNLFDQNCKVDPAPYTHLAVVSAVDAANRRITAASLGQPEDYFGNGKIEFTSGANKGLFKEILNHNAGGVLHLSQPMPFPVEVGDEILAYAGCRKTIQACHNKFNNIKNHWGGFPALPGQDYYASGKGGVSAS